MDLKTILDAGSFGLLVFIVVMIGQKVDKMMESNEKLMTQLIEIIGREAKANAEARSERYPDGQS